jgi:hypothetical protein
VRLPDLLIRFRTTSLEEVQQGSRIGQDELWQKADYGCGQNGESYSTKALVRHDAILPAGPAGFQ